jgi:hypothetical protein
MLPNQAFPEIHRGLYQEELARAVAGDIQKMPFRQKMSQKRRAACILLNKIYHTLSGRYRA